MPSLIVKVVGQPDSHFPIRKKEVVIGRGQATDLLLPNVSVSRKHARLTVEDGAVRVIDLQSSNGTLVNGKRVETWDLSNGDELRIGKFTLVFLGDKREDQIWNGRYIGYLPLYDPDYVRSGGDTTFQLDPATLKRMQRDAEVIDAARIQSVTDPKRSWNPGESGLSFGDKGDVNVEGRFTGGIVAAVSWNGRTHVLEKKGRFATVEINDEPVNAQPLRSGDRFQVGGSKFRYDIPLE